MSDPEDLSLIRKRYNPDPTLTVYKQHTGEILTQEEEPETMSLMSEELHDGITTGTLTEEIEDGETYGTEEIVDGETYGTITEEIEDEPVDSFLGASSEVEMGVSMMTLLALICVAIIAAGLYKKFAMTAKTVSNEDAEITRNLAEALISGETKTN